MAKRREDQNDINHKINDLNSLNEPKKTNLPHNNIPLDQPPPVPRETDSTKTELMNTIQVQIKKQDIDQNTTKRTYLFRRGLILVFERNSFELLLQEPWIRKVLGNEIQISFERNFTSENSQNHVIETILRLKVIYTKEMTESLHDFMRDKTVNDEMAIRINEAFVVVKDEPLSEDWYNFLIRNSNNRFIHYLSRNQMDSRHYDCFSLMESEQLFTSLIKKLLLIKDQIELKILTKGPRVLFTKTPKINLLGTFKESNLTISDSLTNCMGHGGAIEDYQTCSICGGALCSICLDSFLICPGSISTDLHKFIKR